MDETLLYPGGAVKSLGGGRVGGYLVRFSTDADPDLARDFFTPESDFDTDFPAAKSVYFDHGMDPTLKKTKLGRAEMRVDDVGVWAETILDASQKYQAAILSLAEKGALGWSSGSISHLVERAPVGKSFHVSLWPIAECSLTPTPCEPRNSVQSLKSYEAEHGAVKSFKALLTELADAEGTAPPAVPPAVPDTPAVKSQYLGEDIEDSLSFAVVSRLNDALMYNCVMPCLMDDDGPDGETSTADKLATLRPAFDEFRDMSLRVLEAVLSAAGDETPAEAGKSLKSLYAKPSADPAAPRAARLLESLEFKTFLQAMGSVAALTDARASWYEAERAVKQGRALSADNLAAMRDIHDGMKEHVGKLGDLIARHSQGVSASGNSQSSGNKPKALGSEMGAAFMRFMQAHGGTSTLGAATAGQSAP